MADDRANIFRTTVHWRYAMARPRLLFFDARLVFFVILFAFPRATPKCTSENGSVMSVLPCGRGQAMARIL